MLGFFAASSLSLWRWRARHGVRAVLRLLSFSPESMRSTANVFSEFYRSTTDRKHPISGSRKIPCRGQPKRGDVTIPKLLCAENSVRRSANGARSRTFASHISERAAVTDLATQADVPMKIRVIYYLQGTYYLFDAPAVHTSKNE